MLGPDAVDGRAAVRALRRRGKGKLPPLSASKVGGVPALTLPVMKFIAGEPMKPATKRLAGRS